MLLKKIFSMLAIVSTSLTLTAHATPILGLDMDIGTAGIQSTLSVTEGDTFTFDLVAFNDGLPPILVDTVAINLLSLPGTGTAAFGGATAGDFAASMGPPGLGAIDIGDTSPTGIDPSLAPLPVPPIPGSLGYFGYSGIPALLSISTMAAAVAADTFDVLMSFSFTAVTAGDLFFDVTGLPPGSELLFSGAPSGGPLFPTLLGASTLTIMAATPPPPTSVPEPGNIALLALGLAGLMGRKKCVN